ncbi:hypothetical protein GCM10009556_056810 [Acrocarpospora pleiomorpha]
MALIMSVVVALLLGLTPPATAAAGPRFAVPSGSLGNFSVVVAAESVTLELDASGFDRDQMREFLQETQSRNPRLSDTIREDFEEHTNGMPGGGEDPSEWPDFDGQLSITDTGIALRVDSDQPLTNASFWANILAAAAGVLTGLVLRSICIGFAPEAAVMCVVIGNFFGGMTRGIIIQAIDGTLKDGKAWAETLAQSLLLAAGGAAWEGGVSRWSKEVLPGHIDRLGQALVRLGDRLSAGWATFKEGCAAAGEFLREVGRNLADAVSRVRVRSALRVMPAGDSITYGVGSSSGNGYRAMLWDRLREISSGLDFVGSNSSGSMMDDDHNGYPGREIDTIAGPASRDASTMRPNVVTLMAGTNDIQRDVDVANAPARLGRLIDQVLDGSPEVAIAVATLVPVVGDPPAQARRNAFNTEVRALVETYQDQGKKVMLAEMGPMTADMMFDRLHPNDSGYAFIAQEFAETTDAMISRGWVEEPQGGVTDPNVGGGDDGSCPTVGGGWVDRGKIATGGVARVSGAVRFADIDGNGLTDYLLLKDDGAVDAWTKITGGWDRKGQIAPGTGNPGSKVRFADIDGDHDDDYLVVHDNGAVDAWRNDGVYVNGPSGWYSLGRIAEGTGNPGSKVRFADIDGDLDDDYLVMHDNGSIDAWRNNEVDEVGGSGWKSLGQIAEGTGNPASKVRLADLDGDKDADYLVVHDNGAADFWRNDNVDDVGGSGWKSRGQIAKGTALGGGSKVQFADVDSDRDADYLVIGERGEVSLWQNNDVAEVGGSGWTEKGLHVRDLNVSGTVRFADLDGDKDAEYLVVGPGGVVDAWRNDNVDTVGGKGWYQLGRIAKGVSMSSSERVAFADFDGDGDDDYLVVTGAGVVRAWRNDGVVAKGGSAWKEVGTIAHGTPNPGEVQFADIDGDGDDDYLVVASDHSVTAWRNDGTNAPGGGGWTSKGLIAKPTASINEKTMFANLTCDRRADYVLRDPTQNNKLTGWTNLDGFANRWAAPKKVAWGVAVGYEAEIHLADLSGDGLDDYLIVDPRSGATEAWLNAGGNQADR